MKKGETTKEKIIEMTAPLFNQMGFAGASLSDVMRVTGLKKGGIYNHFESKEDLALQAFDHAVSRVCDQLACHLEGKNTAIERLLAFASVFLESVIDPPVAGGCPLLNTAIESDDSHPALRERTQRAMDAWKEQIASTVRAGVDSGELRFGVDGEIVATRLITTLEGGTMMSRLYGDPIYVSRSVDFVKEYILRDLRK